MSTITLLGIDLAKNVYQIHGINAQGRCLVSRQLRRNKLIEYVNQLPPCIIAMESCSGANYLGRKFQSYGHEVKLIAPQFVKPYVKGNKNDSADAEAICEAASRPNMRFVALKAVWQQDLQSLHRIRQRLIKNRTALTNELRGILYEYGIVINQGRSSLEKTIKLLLNESDPAQDMTGETLEFTQTLYSELLDLDTKLGYYDQKIANYVKQDSLPEKLMGVPGIGILSATALTTVLANPFLFKNGRQFSAYLGLVPKHYGTGGINRLSGISKRGNTYIRTLLIHGARSSLRSIIIKVVRGTPLSPLHQWVYQLYVKKGFNKTAVALANKNARIAWAITAKNETFNSNKAATPEALKKAA